MHGAAIAPVIQAAKPWTTSARNRQGAVPRAGLLPWVPVCLGTGIGFWFLWPTLPGPAFWAILGLVMMAALLAVLHALRAASRGAMSWAAADAVRLAGLAIALVAFGMGLTAARAAWVAAPVLEWRYFGPVEGRVIHIDRSGRDRLRLTLDQVRLRNLDPAKVPRKVRLSLNNHSHEDLPPLGQRVMLTGHLGPPPGPASPGSFDFRLQAWFQGLGAVGYTRTPIMAVSDPQGGRWHLHRARMELSAQIRQRIGGQPGAVAAALMTGDRSGISEATTETMRASNLSHVIAISGLHMGILAGFVYAALRLALVLAEAARAPLPLPGHKLAAIGALVAAAGYLWLSGTSVATQRAFVTVAVMLVAILVDRRAISLRTVALAATFILILSPEALVSPGFQMSFAATVGLILALGPWTGQAHRLPFWLRPIALLLGSTLVAGLATAPVSAAHFSRISQYGLLANMLAVPMMGTLIMPMGVLAALLAIFGLEGIALWVMGLGTSWMLAVAQFVAGLEGAVTAIPVPPAGAFPLLAAGALGLVLCWQGVAGTRRGAATTLGLAVTSALAVTGVTMWMTHQRPTILIAPEGEAVGVMTPQGRAVSKRAGGSFVVTTWLLEDGDTASQAISAARPLWHGDGRDHGADLPGGWHIAHFTGKGSGKRAADACRAGRIIVATEQVMPRHAKPDCLLFDLPRLRVSGAVALWIGPEGPVWRSVADTQPSLSRGRP